MKKYRFAVNRGSGIIYHLIPEDKLDKKHIDLLLGELIIKFTDSPKLVQKKFMEQIIELNSIE
ncbi:MAG: hypothetical protein ACTSQF_10875 [Candidatus Heimdallarchaeaceae archaeon]